MDLRTTTPSPLALIPGASFISSCGAWYVLASFLEGTSASEHNLDVALGILGLTDCETISLRLVCLAFLRLVGSLLDLIERVKIVVNALNARE